MLVAVAEIESQMRPNAHSSADARGLLQVLPSTAQETLGYVANVASL
jgi:soluble lytic murein transglycosylase-like protein